MIRYRSVLATGAIAATLLAIAPAGAAQASARAGPSGRILYLEVDRSDGGGQLRSVRPDDTEAVGYGRELSWSASPDYSPDGTRVAYTESFSVYVFSAVDGSGDHRLGEAPCGTAFPRWSPDGKWVALESCGDVLAVSSDGAAAGPRNLTASEQNDLWAAWSPTGTRIATAIYPGVHVYRTVGPSSAPRAVSDLPQARGLDWSPDGRTLAVEAAGDLWLVDAVTGRERRLTNTPGVFESSPTWSPDGRWLAYGSGPVAPPIPPNPGDPPPPINTASLDPQIWLMTAAGTHRHSTGVDGVPTSWHAAR